MAEIVRERLLNKIHAANRSLHEIRHRNRISYMHNSYNPNPFAIESCCHDQNVGEIIACNISYQ